MTKETETQTTVDNSEAAKIKAAKDAIKASTGAQTPETPVAEVEMKVEKKIISATFSRS